MKATRHRRRSSDTAIVGDQLTLKLQGLSSATLGVVSSYGSPVLALAPHDMRSLGCRADDTVVITVNGSSKRPPGPGGLALRKIKPC
ncbi:unnamed protein product, partial [Chrysoparadoxa australica]